MRAHGVLPHLRGDGRALAAASGLGAVGVLFDLARPWPLALAVDHAIAGAPLGGLSAREALLAAAALLVALTAVAGLTDMAAVITAERAAERIGARVRQSVFDAALTLSLRWHDRTRSGEVVSRLTTDVGRLLDAVVAVCATLVPDVLRLGLMITVLAALDPRLALVGLAVLPPLMVLAVRQRRRVRIAQQGARAASGRFTSTAVDLLRNVRAVQAFGRAEGSSARFRDRNDALLGSNLRAVTTEARWAPLADATLAAGAGAVLVVGGGRVLDGALSTGDLLVVMSYVAALYSPVRGLSRLSGVLAKASASADRVADVLRCEERVADRSTRPAPPVRLGVRFDDVTFAYDSGTPVLDAFHLDVRAGETVALVGPSGAGKSTVLHLLLRLYDVDGGAVSLDGVDLRDMSLTALRRRVAFVPQDPWLFDASIADNIAVGARDVTRHGIRDAGRRALVDEFAVRLPDGYDTAVGEGGAALSGGQRRRVAIARAVVSDAPVVLLDEPTASLDPSAAAQVIDAIRASAAGRTVLIVTHDRELAELADRVIQLGVREEVMT